MPGPKKYSRHACTMRATANRPPGKQKSRPGAILRVLAQVHARARAPAAGHLPRGLPRRRGHRSPRAVQLLSHAPCLFCMAHHCGLYRACENERACPGTVIFWHHRTAHMAGQNHSRRIRQAVLYDCPPGARPVARPRRSPQGSISPWRVRFVWVSKMPNG